MTGFIPAFRTMLIKETGTAFDSPNIVNNAFTCVKFFDKFMRNHGQIDRECFVILMLNSQNGVIGANLVSMGNVRSTVVSTPEVIRPAILCGASALILCHNHPSGNTEPSPDDKIVTQRIVNAASVFEIIVQDHLIISTHSDNYYSFCDNGLLEQMRGNCKGAII